MNGNTFKLIEDFVSTIQKRFPKYFDSSLKKGFFQLIANKDNVFFEKRSLKHLLKILLSQFFLQKQINRALFKKSDGHRIVFTKLFKFSDRMCISIILSYDRQTEIFNERDILKILQGNISGTQEVANSFYTWQSIENSYMFCYLEVQKIRGKDLSHVEIRRLQSLIEKQVSYEVKNYCPSVFWPYHHEDAFKQISTLVSELDNEDDIPQISISFKGQTSTDLEYIIYMAYPKKDNLLKKITHNLPSFIRFSLHTHFNDQGHSFANSMVFSIHYPVSKIDKPINLLSVRKSITVLLEDIIGPFRDFNGGLFIKQEDVFDKLKLKLNISIPNFNFFASKLFYSLKPIETQLTLKFELAKILFKTFSEVMQKKEIPYSLKKGKEVLVIKTENEILIKTLVKQLKTLDGISYASLDISNIYYLAILDTSQKLLNKIVKQLAIPLKKAVENKKSLKLVFNEGAPPSLNPCYMFSDVRCWTVYRSLFEGLTRSNHNGKVLLAGAEECAVSQDHTIYRFKLRPTRWNNGEKVTAYHYEQRWKENISASTEFPVNEFSSIKNGEKILKGKCSSEKLGISALDEDILEIKLAFPDTRFLHKLSLPLFFPSYDKSKEPTIFNGPYIISEFNSEILKLEKNPYFWDHKNIAIDTINISFISDSNVIYNLFKQKQLDWIGSPLASVPIQIEKSLDREKTLQKRRSPLSFWLYVNYQHPHLRSKYIRKALSLSLDRKEIHQNIYPGAPLSFPFSKNSQKNNLNFNQIQARVFFEKGLEESKLSLEDFPPIELSYFNTPKMKELAEYLSSTWMETFNIKVYLVEKDWNTFRNSLEKGSFQIGGCFEPSYFPAFSSLIQKFNYLESICSDPSKNALFIKYVNKFQSIGEEKYLTKALDLFADDLKAIPLFNSIQKYACNPKLCQYIFDETGGLDFRWSYFKE